MKVAISQELLAHINHITRAIQHSLGRSDRPKGLLFPSQVQLEQFLANPNHELGPMVKAKEGQIGQVLKDGSLVLVLVFSDGFTIVRPLEPPQTN